LTNTRIRPNAKSLNPLRRSVSIAIAAAKVMRMEYWATWPRRLVEDRLNGDTCVIFNHDGRKGIDYYNTVSR